MYIDERRFRGENGYLKREFLIKCEKCGVEKWIGIRSRAAKQKYCSGRCAKIGKKHTQEWKDNLSKKNSGSNNPFFGKKHSEESLEKMIKFQQEVGGCYNMIKNKLSTEEFDIYWANHCEKMTGVNNPFFGKKHTEESRQKMSKTRSSLIADGYIDLKPSHYGLKGYYTSTKTNQNFRFDSFIEFIRMILLDREESVISWTKRHSIKIQYALDGNTKNYIPDFEIIKTDGSKTIEEVKGYENENKKEAKFSALRSFCEEKGFNCSIVVYDDIKNICVNEFGKSLNTLRKYYKNGNLSWIEKIY
jgi:hypothetical protein